MKNGIAVKAVKGTLTWSIDTFNSLEFEGVKSYQGDMNAD